MTSEPVPGRRPRSLIVMADEPFEDMWGAAEIARLHRLADVDEPVQVSTLDTGDALARLREVEVLISSWQCPRLDADVLAHAPALTTVLHAAGSVRPLVSEALWDRGIQISSAADQNAIPVAEFAVAAVIMAGKKAPFVAAAARTARDDWSRHRDAFGPLTNLDRTVGIIGYSTIGRRVVAHLASLDVEILVYDPVVDPATIAAAGARPVELHQLLAHSDTVSVHAPSLPSTYRMIGVDELALLPDHATVINTARGALIDHDALAAECATGRLNAILDVTDPEPLPADSVLYDLPNVMITPHIAGSLGSETRRMSRHALDELERYITGEPLASVVSPETFAVTA